MSDRLSGPHEALRRWLPTVVAFVVAFAVTADTSGGDPARVIASGAAADPVTSTPATELSSVEPLPDLRRQHRRPRAEHRPRMPAAAVGVGAPRRARSATRTVAIATPPATAPPRPPAAPPPAAPPPAAPPPDAAPPPSAPAAPPRAAPQTSDPAPTPPSPTFDSSGSFDSSG